MRSTLAEKIKLLEILDFNEKGESFVETCFLTPLLECLGYEAHKDYEVIRHGDEGSAFKLRYPPVEKGAKKIKGKQYNPDYIPTIRKKAFWIVEAKSPTDVVYPFVAQYLVQGFQYCIHPEIQAKYLVLTNGLDTAVYDVYGAVFLEREMYEPICEFRSSEIAQKWPEIYELLSVEKLRTRIEADLKVMYDKLCLSSLDQSYPRTLIRRIGASGDDNSRKIKEHVRRLELEEFVRRSEVLKAHKAELDADRAFDLMGQPNGWAGVIFVEKCLADGRSPIEIFSKLTHDFDRQAIFRKLQSFAGVCALFNGAHDESIKTSLFNFLDKHRDIDLSLLNQVECAFIRVLRKRLIISAFPTLEEQIRTELQLVPELTRFVLPPTGFQESLRFEVSAHNAKFGQLLALSDCELRAELQRLEQIEVSLGPALEMASKDSILYRETSFTWFQDYGEGGKHFGFKNIFLNLIDASQLAGNGGKGESGDRK
jgi:hypothetical protein